MSLKVGEIQALLKASYDKKKNDVMNKFIIDKNLSDTRVKVFTVANSNLVYVVHRGSTSYLDWKDNLSYGVGFDVKDSETYKKHSKKHMEAVNKYGAQNIVSLGHSRGALYAAELHKQGFSKSNINLNKPKNVKDWFSKPENEKSQYNISTQLDPVSVLDKFSKTKDNDIVIPSKSFNPITEHKTDVLSNLNSELMVGGNNKFNIVKKVDYSKIRVRQLKDFIKANKNKFDYKVNITNMKKKDLIELVETLI